MAAEIVAHNDTRYNFSGCFQWSYGGSPSFCAIGKSAFTPNVSGLALPSTISYALATFTSTK
ncbi:hypothetical protein QDY72_04330 [Kingella negevensis]|uniref:hypothetical protein n=1 Tax=Kingella negevensis TaxID=1522312 RepID=UPI00254EC5BF|nr:hypothetical protein [Kingella negevensis]MDK4684411.1 hypothetical protein [Kingella negevensis]MDK4707563.1 hypothetical protein [Kingella negevensis]